MAKAAGGRARATRRRRPNEDEALVALFIAAMSANGHVSAAEGARAQNLIWSTRRFRRRDGDRLGRLIDRVRTALEGEDPALTIEKAARAIPARLRPSAFALVTDLVLADGTMDRQERRFLERLGEDLRLNADRVARIIEVVRIKNSL
jgi:hypothetical protein